MNTEKIPLSEVSLDNIKKGDAVLSLRGQKGFIKEKIGNRGHYRGVYDDELVIDWANGSSSVCPHSMLTGVLYVGESDLKT